MGTGDWLTNLDGKSAFLLSNIISVVVHVIHAFLCFFVSVVSGFFFFSD